MKRLLDLLDRAAKLDLWLSSYEIRGILKLKEGTYRCYMALARDLLGRHGRIERRGVYPNFEYKLEAK